MTETTRDFLGDGDMKACPLRAVFSISLFLAVFIIRRVFMLDLFVFPELIHSLLDFERRRVIHGCP